MTESATKETKEHIGNVEKFLRQISMELKGRAAEHDKSKLNTPEKETFDRVTPKLRGLTYGSPEYQEMLSEMKPALDHHYRNNRHHPEHHQNGIDGMNLIDLIEMLADWKAATLRHEDGDITTSIKHNAKRFNLSPQLEQILLNTVPYLGW